MSGECGLPGQKLSNDREPRNSLLLPLLVAGAYDPSSIWFQYFLCKDQQIYCYFFTQGWNQYEYGQYYLYENLLDDTNGIFAGATGSSDLATLALLGGLGGGSHHGGYYPSSGYSQGAAVQGRKRRETDECEENGTCNQRKRRENNDCEETGTCNQRKRRENNDCEENGNCNQRKRRETADDCENDGTCNQRKRRETADDCEKDGTCHQRKRRQADDCEENGTCDRKRRDACDACKKNPDSIACKECL